MNENYLRNLLAVIGLLVIGLFVERRIAAWDRPPRFYPMLIREWVYRCEEACYRGACFPRCWNHPGKLHMEYMVRW